VGRRHQEDVVAREKVGIRRASTMRRTGTLDGSDWEQSLEREAVEENIGPFTSRSQMGENYYVAQLIH
jgi:hypothetical protein